MQAENRQADIAVDRENLEKTFKHIDISRLSGEIVERAKKVKFLVLDIDGVCTNGQLYINPRGETTKTFHVHDGIGIKTAFMAGIGVGIITGRKDTCVEARMRPLGVTEFFAGITANWNRLRSSPETSGFLTRKWRIWEMILLTSTLFCGWGFPALSPTRGRK